MRLNLRLLSSALLALSFTLSSALSHAADAPRWTVGVKVKAIEVQLYGNVYIYVEGDTPDFGCLGADSDAGFQLDPNASNYQVVLRMLISAKLSGLKVDAYSASCSSYYPLLQSMRLSS